MPGLLLVSAFLAALQAKSPETLDRLQLQDRSEYAGAVVGCASGRLSFRGADGRELQVSLEEIARIRFGGESAALPVAVEQIRLHGGGVVSGRGLSFDGEVARLESFAGPLRLRRRDLKSIVLGTMDSGFELRNDSKDVLVRVGPKTAAGGEGPTLIDYGRLLSIGEQVRFQVATPAEGGGAETLEERAYPRESVRHVYLQSPEGLEDAAPGWFAKLTLKNGDRWMAVLLGISEGKLRLFSSAFGDLDLETSRVQTLSFVPQSRLSAGHILVADQTGLHEYDPRGQEIWTFQANVQGASMARKLRNGNVLVASANSGTVLEIRPSGRAGGDIVWRLNDLQMPVDAVRLDNGNTLVAERLLNRVAEFDGKSREVVWQKEVQIPTAVQRLDNGNTLITTTGGVFEFERSGRLHWSADLQKGPPIRPWRATRLENGTTLIVDQQRRQVVELDAASNVVWKASVDSSPVAAERLEDGNTLILEQGANRVIEVDAQNPRKIETKIPRLLNPQGLSVH